jgi:hypothetical protein
LFNRRFYGCHNEDKLSRADPATEKDNASLILPRVGFGQKSGRKRNPKLISRFKTMSCLRSFRLRKRELDG